MAKEAPMTPHQHDSAPRPWFWEGNVQAAVTAFLEGDGWSITHAVDTASRERGKDVEATRAGATLWVTVKGYPESTPRTTPSTQARHWFSAALFDVILWREEDSNAEIAIALPAMRTYQRLAERTRWFRSAARCRYIWVTESGVVRDFP